MIKGHQRESQDKGFESATFFTKADLLPTWTAVLRNPDAFCNPASSRILFGQPEKSCREQFCFPGSSWHRSQKVQAQFFATTFARFAAANRLRGAAASQKEFTVQASVSSNARQTITGSRWRPLSLTQTSNQYWPK